MRQYRLLCKLPLTATVPKYSGTYRPEPTYIDELPEGAPVNQTWLQALGPSGSAEFANRQEAEALQELFLECGVLSDLVLVVSGDELTDFPDESSAFGFDVSHRSGYSLLSWGLQLTTPTPEFWHFRADAEYVPLMRLIELFFRPRLNDNGLFSKKDEAVFFQQIAKTMTKGFGGVWESPGYGDFDVTLVIKEK